MPLPSFRWLQNCAPTPLAHREGQVQKSAGLTAFCSLCLLPRGVDKAFTKGETGKEKKNRRNKARGFLIPLWVGGGRDGAPGSQHSDDPRSSGAPACSGRFCEHLWGSFCLLRTEGTQKCVLRGLSEPLSTQREERKACLSAAGCQIGAAVPHFSGDLARGQQD